jgi:hypothetical protein
MGVDYIGSDQRADEPNPLFDEVNWRTMQLKRIAATTIPTQVEGYTVTDQRTDLIYS